MPELLISAVKVKIDGSDIPPAMHSALVLVEVDSSLHMPGAFRLEFTESTYGDGANATGFTWVDDNRLAVGKDVEVLAVANPARPGFPAPQPVPLIKGSITALDPVFDEGGAVRMVVRGFDILYKLQRGTKTRTFQNMTDSQIVSRIAGEAGLQSEMDSTSAQHEYVMQDDVSDYDFLLHLARRNGLVMMADNRTLMLKAPDAFGVEQVSLTWTESLLEFRPTFSIGGQVNEVQVHGWDLKQKREVAGTASSPSFAPVTNGYGKRGMASAQAASGVSKLHIAGTAPSQNDAETMAKVALNRMAAADVMGEGSCQGEPRVKAGCKVELRGLGTRFSGTYLVTRVRHYFSPKTALRTDFWVGGMTSGTIAQLVAPEITPAMQRSSAFTGLVPAIVTNNNDPDKNGRVKVRFPTLSQQEESAWARVVAPGAGAARGLAFFPEVNDEVVVGFANSDPNQPYVLGGVWNGRDKLPTAQNTAMKNGQVEVREWKTRAGHVLRFTDSAGSEQIELIDKTGSNSIVIDSASNKITVKAQGDVHIEGSTNVSVKAGSKLSMEAVQVNVAASAKLSLKAPIVDIAGDGKVSVTAPMVMIN